MQNRFSPTFALLIVVMIASVGTATDLSLQPGQIDEWIERAEQSAATGDDENAIRLYQRAIGYLPDNSELLCKLGKLHYHTGNFHAAAAMFSRAAEVEPERADHHNDAGCAYGKAKNNKVAIEYLKRAVELDPNRSRYANNLATYYVDNGQDLKAVTTLEKAHRNPASVQYNMAYLYNARGRKEEALVHVEAALLHDPKLVVAIRLREKLRRAKQVRVTE